MLDHTNIHFLRPNLESNACGFAVFQRPLELLRCGIYFRGRWFRGPLLWRPVNACPEETVNETDLIHQKKSEASADDSGNRRQIPSGGLEVFPRVRDWNSHGRSHQHHANDRPNAKYQQVGDGPQRAPDG